MTTKLLAVDDSKTMRKVLEITFAGNTYDSTIVGSADEALAAVRSAPPQVAVVDGYLAGASGYDLCQQIKEASPTTKVVLLSSKQRPFDAAKAATAGVDEHFDKPFDSTKFLDKLSQLDLGAPSAAGLTPAPAPSASPKAPPVAAPRPAAAPPPMASSSPASQSPASAATASTSRSSMAASSARSAAPRPTPPSASTSSGLSPRPPVAKAPVEPPAKPAPKTTSASAGGAASSAAAAVAGSMTDKLQGMGLTPEQVAGVLSLSREVVEQVVWEVVPQLAETMIKEEIARLTAE